MFKRKEADKYTVSIWHVLMLRKRNIAIFVLLFCISAISSCGATSTTTTAPSQPQTQSSVVAHPFHTTMQTFDKDFSLTLDITPDRSGTNIFVMRVIDNHTNKPAIHVNITLYTTMQDMPMGTNSIVLHANENGQFSATSDLLSMSGHWAIGIIIQTSDYVMHKAGVNLVLLL